jgi:hypothetical protein
MFLTPPSETHHLNTGNDITKRTHIHSRRNRMMAERGLVAASLPRTENRIPIMDHFEAAIG